MTKVLKIIGKMLIGILEWITLLLVIFAFAIRSPYVQTSLAKTATNYLTKQLNHRVSIGKVDFLFYNRLILEDVYLDDNNHDTLASIQELKVSLNYLLLSQRKVNIRYVSLKNGCAYLKKDSLTKQFNFSYLSDYFASNDTTKSKPFALHIKDVQIANLNFKFENNTKKPIPFGVDYSHIDARKIYVSASDVKLKGIDVEANLKHVSLREKSGFILSKLSTQAKLSNRGLFTRDLSILTPNTSAKFPKVFFWMNGLSGFTEFVDEVSFDAIINPSQVDMKDVSYFAPQLQGMDEIVHISAIVKDKVKNMKINNLQLDLRQHTTIQGDLTLPDFRNILQEDITQSIKYAYLDIAEVNDIKLPLGSYNVHKLGLNEYIQRLGYAELKNVSTSGKPTNLFVRLNELKTGVGTVRINHNVNIFKLDKDTYAFKEIHEEGELPIALEQVNLGKIIDQNKFGIVDGNVHLDAFYSSKIGFYLEEVFGTINQFDFNAYNYTNIHLEKASYKGQKVIGDITVKDPNLDLSFNGEIDFNKIQSYRATIDIRKAFVSRLKLIPTDSLLAIKGKIQTDISGTELNLYSGDVLLDSVEITNGTKHYFTKEATISLINTSESNSISMRSDIADLDINGIINFPTVFDEIQNTLSYSFPAFISSVSTKKKQKSSHFNYLIHLKNANPILAVFIDDLNIASGTKIQGIYSSENAQLELSAQAPFVYYQNLKGYNLVLKNNFLETGMDLNYAIQKFKLNDSISFDSLNYVAHGTTDLFSSSLDWDLHTPNASEIKWNTRLSAFNDIILEIQKSYFAINKHRWEMQNDSYFSYYQKDIEIRNLILHHENQSLTLNGKLSESPDDKLNIIAENLDLTDLADIFSINKDIKGIANGEFDISDIYHSTRLFGDIQVQDLVLDGSEVGDINLKGKWDNDKKAISVVGDLIYRETKSFNIVGDYYANRDKDNLDFKLEFDKTNISFMNTFMDPTVISNIKGYLDGHLDVKGELSKPLITGFLDLKKGNVKVGMFGVNYGFNGKVKVSDGLIQIDNMPITDEDGNSGFVNGGIVHDNYSNFNFDVFVGLDDVKKPNGESGSFLAMNTHYTEGAIYYGKAYVNGWVNIDGYLDNLNIEVNVKTGKNTVITLPMYGSEEIDDVLSYTIVNKDSTKKAIDEKLDLTGVNLDLNFNMTPDALVKLVFDDKTGDEMAANGSGLISIKLNTNNDLTMDGTYTISKGYYNFVFNPIKKEFKVQNGSTISWKGGSPTDADLDITAIYNVNTDLSVITSDLESMKSVGSTQNVDAKIFISGYLDNPKLLFQLSAPKASESAKAALDRINSDKVELNKQFFMLLLSGRFQGSGVSASDYGSNAALEALSGQINNMLDAVSKDVRLNVDLKSNESTGQSSQAIGFEKNFLNDKLIIKGNFGVQNHANKGQVNSSTSSFIGDLNIEYIIDDKGNLRISIFNESNNYSVIQDKNLGPFTQGVSLIYSESFNKIKEMDIINFIMDWFRKDKHFKFTKRRRQSYLPEYKTNGIINEQEKVSN
jgi:hypothetical protein